PAQALEPPPVRAEGQPGVLPGHRRITDHDVVVGAPADPDDLVLLEAVAAALAPALKLVPRSPSPARAPPHGVPAVWLPGIRPPAGPRSMVIARAASLLPGSTVLASSPPGRMPHGCVPAFRRTTWPGRPGAPPRSRPLCPSPGPGARAAP